ncbi:YdeI/OmpD-associated family protein [Streptomyces sp. NPDC014891]|uniref:YdeI/OmpD-associated family protein n=1 Tax=Streptomyces sp. NPDC014891 TaxID=3364929 RepID=UPI0036FA8E1A
MGARRAARARAGLTAPSRRPLALDTEPRVVVVPPDLARALDDDSVARAAYEGLTPGRRREHVRAVESAMRPETRRRRIEQAVAALRG